VWAGESQTRYRRESGKGETPLGGHIKRGVPDQCWQADGASLLLGAVRRETKLTFQGRGSCKKARLSGDIVKKSRRTDRKHIKEKKKPEDDV